MLAELFGALQARKLPARANLNVHLQTEVRAVLGHTNQHSDRRHDQYCQKPQPP